jgi:ribonucleoside-diphosphate reductase alpha chain
MMSPRHLSTRHRLPPERLGIVHEFNISGHTGVIRIGEFSDGALGEIFLSVSQGGSTMHGMMEAFATVTSVSLQYGVPLEVLAAKFIGSRFDPQGPTKNREIATATSILDYVFRWLLSRYGKPEVQPNPQPEDPLELPSYPSDPPAPLDGPAS